MGAAIAQSLLYSLSSVIGMVIAGLLEGIATLGVLTMAEKPWPAQEKIDCDQDKCDGACLNDQMVERLIDP
jgi:hypothetical protein